ncbi:transposase family protein [Streptomyces sp. NBC_01643]|uniref:transposase family protein n=1 Tax=Streptomyces sp. NBC_01643 TaxID=2975906 RepID=UPI0038649835
MDATEVQVRRPPSGRGGRRAFVSGKKKTEHDESHRRRDHQGRTLWTDAMRPGRMHDATAARNEGISTCFQHFRDVEVLLDDGCLGHCRDHPGQAVTPPRKGNKISPPEVLEARLRARHRHSSKRITVEHALADHKRWKPLIRWTHRRENLPSTYRAIAGLVSDRNTTG